MKPLDIVRSPSGLIGIVKETKHGGMQASVDWIRGQEGHEKNAWWRVAIDGEVLTVIDSLPRLISSAMAHPLGSGEQDVGLFFGRDN